MSRSSTTRDRRAVEVTPGAGARNGVVHIPGRNGVGASEAAKSHTPPGPVAANIAGGTDPLYGRRLAAAKELTQKTTLVIGGEIAVNMHGAVSKAPGLVLYAPAADEARRLLERSGFKSWLAEATFTLAGVEAKVVECVLPGKKEIKPELIQGVRVPALPDLVAVLLCRVKAAGPAGLKGLTDVQSLIALHHLDKRFAARLPASIRGPFNDLVETARDGGKRTG